MCVGVLICFCVRMLELLYISFIINSWLSSQLRVKRFQYIDFTALFSQIDAGSLTDIAHYQEFTMNKIFQCSMINDFTDT